MILEIPPIQLYCELTPVTSGKSPPLFLFYIIPVMTPLLQRILISKGLMRFKKLS